jgi:NADH:ubiquinone oxidoreductase subunit 2 (subunit N)
MINLSLICIVILFFFNFNLYNINVDLFIGFKVDEFFFIFKLIFLTFLLLFFIVLRNVFVMDKIYSYEYILLILLSVQGSFLVVFTKNLFIFFLAIEIQTLCFYILASLKRYSNFSTEAGIKYFLLGSFSSSLMLYGISLLYGLFGTLDIISIFFILSYYGFPSFNILLFFSFFFLFSGLMFKLGAAPFHW